MIYFDHNATSPLSTCARAAWLDAVDRYPANPSSPHRLGGRADAALNQARQAAAAFLGCSPLELVWTSGATEANNAIFYHASQDSRSEVWVSGIEHPSVLAAAQHWFPGRVQLIPVSASGIVDLSWLEDHLARTRPALVSVMAANNETGVLQPWREALELCRQREVPFACDAAQWIGKVASAGLGASDFVTGSAHKFGGPLGAGFMKVPPGFRPLLVGGPQEDDRRAGTENVPALIALAAAWSEREHQLASGAVQLRQVWRDDFIHGLARRVSGVEVLGLGSQRLWNTVAVIMPALADCRRRWVVKLDKLGCAVSTGSACASGKERPSHVLLAMGDDGGRSDRMLRFSAGWDTTAAEWEALLNAIAQAVQDLT